ncbi:hypothetical protein V501_03000 [Pseudogymnoascus sp. VKM F-4519 (FW-2642)]|nr:hypothetical protein V501_03000 [Pseudogymnoascus sp. VKM F-4519 (FW-2642)]
MIARPVTHNLLRGCPASSVVVKELEARLGQLEDSVKNAKADLQPPNPSDDNSIPWDWDHAASSISGAESLLVDTSAAKPASVQPEVFASDELIRLGLFEHVPPLQVMEDLIDIYFDKLHYGAPMLHRSRYTTSVLLPSPMRPLMCLQYIVMALAAASTETFRHLATPFYQRARAYAELDEMMMLNFHRIGKGCEAPLLTLPPPKDWSELEERRRTWWVIFCSDRFVCGTTGWPTLINERDIHTLLPASDEAFDGGVEEQTSSLMAAIRQENRGYSSFAGRVLVAHMFHRAIEHTSQSYPNDNPQDIKNGPYWRRQRGIDNDLATMLMFLPGNIRLPRSIRCQNAVFVNVYIHTTIICIHRAAVSKITAEEILNIFRMVNDLDATFKNPLMAFSIYVAALVFLEDFVMDHSHQSEDNLNFLQNIMIAFGRTNAITRSLAIQLAMDMRQSGFDASATEKVKGLYTDTELIPLLTKRDYYAYIIDL